MPENNMLNVLFNGELALEYDRNKAITEIQSEYLNNMDQRMEMGIEQEGKKVILSSQIEKAQFAANAMVYSLLNQNVNHAIAMCIYLATRMPHLEKILCLGEDDENGIKIEFVYERELSQSPAEETIKFFDPKDYLKK